MKVIVIYGEEEQRVIFEDVQKYSILGDVLTIACNNGDTVMFNWGCVSAVGSATLIEAIE